MKINRTLHITNEEFFNTLLDNVIKDINKSTNKKIKMSDLKKGFKFTSSSSSNRLLDTSFEITSFERNSFYAAKQTSVNGTRFVSYKITPDQDGINVEFEQILPFSEKKHFRLFQCFSEAIFLGRMSDHLFEIQKQVLKKQEDNH